MSGCDRPLTPEAPGSAKAAPPPAPPELCLITNRALAAAPLEVQAGKILAAGASRVILREKDLAAGELLALARSLAGVAAGLGRRLIVNSSLEAAEEVRAWGLHLPLADFLRRPHDPRLKPFTVGVSVHSLAEALEAEALGADYLLTGPIFPTECKAGAPGRGLEFVRELKARLTVPLWAVGGISPAEARPVIQAGAKVVCVMSSLMRSPEPEKLTAAYLAAMAGA